MAKVTRERGSWKLGTTASFSFTGFEPVSKGSMKGFAVGRRAVVVDTRAKELRAFERDVRSVVVRELDRLGLPCAVKQPFELRAVFYLPRSSGHFGAGLLPSAPASPMTKPDLDKLVRAFCDAATGLIWDDDSRVVDEHTKKVFASAKRDVGLWVRVRVLPATIRELYEQQQTALVAP